jgi:starch-binding outer membrane protein, SusD/RagB family
VLNLARVGKARALLGLGDLAAAAQVASEVPDGFRYEVGYPANDPASSNFALVPTEPFEYSVGDREGVNGLDFRSSADPRTAASFLQFNISGGSIYHPDKYARDGSTPIVLADWVEARLIQAEAALAGGDASWLTTLNLLRRTAVAPALPDTTDPGPDEAGGNARRVDLLFRERAFWLFLTGHRQGDLRRLIRQYGRGQHQVYPTGPYDGGPALFGDDVTLPIPYAERQANSLFTGCFGRGA